LTIPQRRPAPEAHALEHLRLPDTQTAFHNASTRRDQHVRFLSPHSEAAAA